MKMIHNSPKDVVIDIITLLVLLLAFSFIIGIFDDIHSFKENQYIFNKGVNNDFSR